MNSSDNILNYYAGLAPLGPDDLASIVGTLGIERFFNTIRVLYFAMTLKSGMQSDHHSRARLPPTHEAFKFF
jgi:hypothetical protein